MLGGRRALFRRNSVWRSYRAQAGGGVPPSRAEADSAPAHAAARQARAMRSRCRRPVRRIAPRARCRIAPSPQAGQKGGRRRRVEDATPAVPHGCRGPNARRGGTRGKRGSATAAEAPAPAQSRRRMRRPPRAPRGPARPDRPPKRPGARAGSFCSRKGRPRSAPAAAGEAPSRAAPAAP